MTYRLSGPRTATSRDDVYPQVPDSALAEAESLLLDVLQRLHPGLLTDEQKAEMAQALAVQTAATSVLRRFALGNDDAPCFVKVPAREAGDA